MTKGLGRNKAKTHNINYNGLSIVMFHIIAVESEFSEVVVFDNDWRPLCLSATGNYHVKSAMS